MAQVDPKDDTITRFIVHHFRFDPDRHERRHAVVAAFDNEREFRAGIDRVTAEIADRRARGEQVDPREHASGVVHEPGNLRRAANAHLLRRAIQHRVAIHRLENAELLSGVAVFRAERPVKPPPS